MQMMAAPWRALWRGVVSLWVGAFLGGGVAHADQLQDAHRFLKAGQHREALEHVNTAIAAKPRDPQARFLKAVILTEQGNTREAIDLFTRLTQEYPELPEPYNNLAVIYASQGQYDKARIALEQSIRTHPHYATAYENLGDVYAKLASQAYDKALQLDKSNTAAQNKLSLVREIARAPAKAEDATAEVLRAVNGWARAWSNRDADAYFAYYADDFDTPSGVSRAAWERARRDRIEGAKKIEVNLSTPKVTMNGPDQATVSFRQAYQSDRFKATASKTLVMVRSAEGRWQIQQEKSR